MPVLSPTGVRAPALQPSLIPAVRSFLTTAMGQAADPRVSTEHLALILDAAKRTDDKVEELQVAEQGILRDRTTSDEGKLNALVTLAEKSVERFAFLGRMAEQASVSMDDYERQLYADLEVPAKESDGARLVRELRACEVRGLHEGDNYDAVFLQALEKGNMEVARALLDAPTGSLVSDDVLQRGKVQFAQRTNKALYTKWQSVERLRDRLQGIANFVAKMLLRLGAKPETVAAVFGDDAA